MANSPLRPGGRVCYGRLFSSPAHFDAHRAGRYRQRADGVWISYLTDDERAALSAIRR